MEDLKSCPFCGGKAFAEPFKARKGYECPIQCSRCLALMQSITYDTEEEAVQAATKAWNRRAYEKQAD